MCWKRAVGFLFSNLRQLNRNIKGKVQKVLANELCHDYALGAHERANCGRVVICLYRVRQFKRLSVRIRAALYDLDCEAYVNMTHRLAIL